MFQIFRWSNTEIKQHLKNNDVFCWYIVVESTRKRNICFSSRLEYRYPHSKILKNTLVLRELIQEFKIPAKQSLISWRKFRTFITDENFSSRFFEIGKHIIKINLLKIVIPITYI